MKISKYYRAFLRTALNAKNKKRLSNRNFTIICNNCVWGGDPSRVGGNALILQQLTCFLAQRTTSSFWKN